MKQLSHSEVSRKGGQAVLKKYGKKHFSNLRKKGLKMAKAKKLSTKK